MLETLENDLEKKNKRGIYYHECEFNCHSGQLSRECKTQQAKDANDGTMVTVVCITYKHEEFIAQALDSFLMQKTNFKFKIFVGEDHGPDGTADIVRAYAERYPDVIVPFIRKENMGAQRNLINMCQRATSPYIAFCEGDDYWVDEYKLQKQFDYMEANPHIRVCCTQTEVIAPIDWHLRSWYKPLADGKIVLPDSTPGYQRFDTFSAENIFNINVAHTSTHFYRWNYDLEIPEWYYNGIIGDMPLLLMQMGETRLGHIPEITSVYRINEGSIFFNKDRERHFLTTRKDMVRYLSGLREYALEHFENYPIVALENRIKLETANYLKVLIKREDYKAITDFFESFPKAAMISLNAYLEFYWDQRALTACYGWDGYKIAVRNRIFRKAMSYVIRCALKFKSILVNSKKCAVKFLKKIKKIIFWILYWKNTFVKKNKDLWVFFGFKKTSYMDNSKYLYEYILSNHPEIRAVWITKSQDVYQKLVQEGKPVELMNTINSRKLVSHASIGVFDHFKVSDCDALAGLNDKLKIVQLWHGVGLKSIKDIVDSSTFEGVSYDHEIFSMDNDTFIKKLQKRIKYYMCAHNCELYEKYFMLVCPGKERIEQIAKPMGVPLDSCFMSGHSRNIFLHKMEAEKDEHYIIYAPTFRWNVKTERKLVSQIVDASMEIQDFLNEIHGRLIIRLHPHTWRNYKQLLESIIEQCNRIELDCEMDVYKTLGKYEILITDYSSIAYDFVLLDRPIIFLNFDYEEYISKDTGFNYDYNDYSPGIKTKTWESTLVAIEQYIKNPEKDGEWRRRIRDEFYDMSVNDEYNSERIVHEIKRRLDRI